jgi:hypothetical protein
MSLAALGRLNAFCAAAENKLVGKISAEGCPFIKLIIMMNKKV